MATALPAHALTEQQVRLLGHIAAESTVRTIVADPELPWERSEIDHAIQDLIAATGTCTASQLAAWGTARRIITATSEPCAALTTPICLPPRLYRVLVGWVGGRTTLELTVDFDVTAATLRGYGRDLRAWLGVRTQIQASIAAVLSGLVYLSDIDPTWPAEPLRHAAPRGRAA
ncbi:hypothetical protein [Kitasatospora sp. NPDC087314]|uniref:hypothetical protein n=1 Tax=Kitasatospora sp. NPDC087314 TaxID=3364068 RepID=UPI00381B07C5